MFKNNLVDDLMNSTHVLKITPDKIEKVCNSMVNHIKTDAIMVQIDTTMKQLDTQIDKFVSTYGGDSERTPTRSQREAFEQSKALYHKLRLERENALRTKYANFHKKFPTIFKTIEDGVDETTLKDVLQSYRDLYEGKASYGKTLNRGADFMTNKYNLPAGMFNRMKE